jgi:hypothetical protein
LVSVLPLLRASLDSFRLWPEKAKKVVRKEECEARHGACTLPHVGEPGKRVDVGAGHVVERLPGEGATDVAPA